MNSKNLLAPLVSSAVALIVVTNYCIIRLLGHPNTSASELIGAIWPMALPASIAVILVMSVLYHTLQDVLAELAQRQAELLERTRRDALTGVASRQFFEERLQQALLRFRRAGERFAVIILDLDHFKRVNDLHGHQTGDELLKIAAARLSSLVRDGDIVARFGGDEFLILQTGLAKSSDVRRLCDRVCSELQHAYEVGSIKVHLPASVGAVVANKELNTASDYIRAADMALYEAKGSGRNCFRFFCDELDERLRRRDLLETDLRAALRTGIGLKVHFQPQISAEGDLLGAEALLRWTHPSYGEIGALEAVGIAVESNLIDILGEFVLRESAALARRHPTLSIAVNLSPAQFLRADDFASKMKDIVEQEDIDPSRIEFEVTEQIFIGLGNGSESQMQRLRDCGFRLTLDNFGTGYSSLSCLRRYKVDRLKLDKSFAATGKVEEDVAILRAAVGLAHQFQLEVVVEGIETKVQEAVALESGCDALQGNRYGAPMSARAFNQYVDQRLRAAA